MVMDSRKLVLAVMVLVALVGFVSGDAISDLADYIWDKSSNVICGIYSIFVIVAGGLASVIIVHSGIKWINGRDDPGVRKNAKDTIIHTIVALLVILVAKEVVSLVISGPSC